MTTEKFIEGYKDFTQRTQSYVGVQFKGFYNMDDKHFISLLSHFLETKENLLDVYTTIIKAQSFSENENSFVGIKVKMTAKEYKFLSGFVTHPVLNTMFSRQEMVRFADYLINLRSHTLSLENVK